MSSPFMQMQANLQLDYKVVFFSYWNENILYWENTIIGFRSMKVGLKILI